MAYTATPKRALEWDPSWNQEVLTKELQKKDRSLRAILRERSTEDVGWQGLYRDVCRWRKLNPKLDALIKEHSKEVSNKTHAGGRHRLDATPENSDWRLAFAREYLATFSKVKAAAVTPYAPDTIITMLNEKNTAYDKKFAEIVEVCDRQLLEKARELTFSGIAEAANPNSGVSPDKKVQMGVSVMKIARGTDWNQQKIDVNMSGTVKFEAARAKLTGELIAEQRSHFQKVLEMKQLTSGEQNVIDAEVLPEKELVQN